MKTRLAPRPLIACALLALVVPVAARAAIPGAEDPKAFTRHDYLRQRLEFHRRMLRGEYDRVGHRDPKWDEKATAFLDAMAVYFTYNKADPLYRDEKPAPRPDLIAMAKAAIDAGCEDPLVLYCRGVLLYDNGNSREAVAALDRALRGPKRRKGPPHVIADLTLRLARMYAGRPSEESRKYVAMNQKLAWDASVAALTQKWDDKDLRHILELADSVFQSATVEKKLEFCKAIEKATTANPWVVNLLYGRYEIRAAWEIRGSGFANTVTPEGWRGLAEHMTKARDYLTKAHALHPEFPEAAADMITVAMAEGDRLNEATRDWFDKSVKAQFDYAPAYEAYTWAMMPRWGGTHLELFRFGQDCVATGRYDTDVPYQLMRIVRLISGDNEDGDQSALRVLAVPQVYAAVEKLFTTLADRTTDPDLKARYASEHIAVAWRAGRYDAAATVMDAFDGKVDPQPFNDLLAWAPGALSEVRLMTSKRAKEATAAAAAAQEGNFAVARDAYAKIADALPPDHPGQLFARHRLRAMEIQAKLATTTDWIPLTPAADLAPWTVVTGDFKLTDDGKIEVTSDLKKEAVLLCRADLGPAYELRATVETVQSPQSTSPSLFVDWWWSRGYGAAGLASNHKSVNAYGQGGGRRQAVEIADGPAVLGVRVDGQRFTVTLNDKPVIADVPLNPRTPSHDAFAGIGVRGPVAGSVTRFSNIEVRRIAK